MKINKDAISLPEGTKIPNHVALICDGNRRWARSRGLPTLEGHRMGFEAAKKIAKSARQLGIHTMTAWIFSTENWDRSPEELSYLMDLYRQFLKTARKEAREDGVRVVHLGRKDRLPADIIELIKTIEDETRDNLKFVLNVALDYGGKDEIARAVNKYVAALNSGKESRPMDEKVMLDYLDTCDQPYPMVDMLIRTSGEQRTSGLLIWQAAYAELYWELEHLPDFSIEKLREAVLDYSRRRRRFGGNDKEEHMKFKPAAVAKLELDWRRELPLGESDRFRDLVIKYVKEQYGLSKELAKTAGISMAKALIYREQKDWAKAKIALKELYEVVKKNLNLAMEPELVANIEVDMWQDPSEQKLRQLYAETYRVSDMQMSKAAHLAMLANGEMEKKNWDKAKSYSEMFYKALKERVA